MQELLSETTPNLLNTITILERDGLLKPLVDAGVISPNLLNYRDIYQFVNEQIQCGKRMAEVEINVEKKFKMKRTRLNEVLRMFK